jgi:hypothetical protein
VAAITIPILPSADFDHTAGFWAGFGFAEIGRWPQEYLILRHEGLAIELHFWPNPQVDRWTNDVGCYVRFDGPAEATAQRAAWSSVEVPAPGELSPLRHGPGGPGSVEFHVIDVHGNLVRFGGFPPA